MKFNRQLFKEAYKAGYKKARLLENKTDEDNESSFVKKLYDALVYNDDPVRIEGEYYDEINGKYVGNFSVTLDPHYNYFDLRNKDPRATSYKMFVISGKEIKRVEILDYVTIAVYLRGKSKLYLTIFVAANPKNLLRPVSSFGEWD